MSAPVARSEQLKGARFGPHEIVGLIGHGATASVFEAQHVALGKAVAVKILHDHLAHDAQIANRFLREGRVAARLRHPNIVDVLDVGVEQGIPYLVMELLHGTDLRVLLGETHLLTLEHALGFLLPIASAIAHAHDLGVIHRDLKPANIFLARDVRDDIVPKLVDFGLSKATGFDDDGALTSTEMVAGTVLYMAPEQTFGMKFASPASDQYSLAAILYECITGEAPFSGDGADGVYALIERIRGALIKPPSMINPRLPADVDGAILRALHAEPTKRFASVRDFARALLPFAPEETVAALQRDFSERPSSSSQPASRAGSRPSIRRAAASARVSSTSRVAANAITRVESPSESGKASASVKRSEKSAPSASRAHKGDAPATSLAAPLPCAPGASPFHMKGNPYRGLVRFVEKSIPGGLDRLCATFEDARIATFLRQPFLASGRYDILPFFPISVALARLLGVPYDVLVETSTSAQARYDARTVYKRIFEGTKVTDIAERISRFNANYYDFGACVGENDSPTMFHIEHQRVPAYMLPWYAPMSVAYTSEVARIMGAVEAKGSSRAPEPAGKQAGFELANVRIEVRWK